MLSSCLPKDRYRAPLYNLAWNLNWKSSSRAQLVWVSEFLLSQKTFATKQKQSYKRRFWISFIHRLCYFCFFFIIKERFNFLISAKVEPSILRHSSYVNNEKNWPNRNNIFKFNRQTFCAQKTLFGVGEYDSYVQLNLEEALATTACEIVVLWPRFFYPLVSLKVCSIFSTAWKNVGFNSILLLCACLKIYKRGQSSW